MDADMKSFLYSAHSIILFPISFLFPCKSIFGKRFDFFIPVSIPPIITLNPRFMSIIWAKISHKVQK